MARWEPWQVIDGAYKDDARPWSSQDTVNWLPEPAEQGGTRSPIMLRTPPGLIEFCDLGTDAPLRGSHDVEGLLLVVSDTTLFRVSTDGVATSIGTIPGVGRVSMDHTPRADGSFHVAIANGNSGYVYDTGDDSLTQITDEGFPGAVIFQFIDGYLAFLEPFGKFWGHSELNDALSYNTLDRYTAESAPDRIVSLIVSHREVFVLGTRTGEFFRNTGAATGTFARADGYEMERGICSPYAIDRTDNTVKWVGDDGMTYVLQGHQPVRVSNGPIEQAFARSNLENAFAFTWDDRGHDVFYVTLPDGQTWGHDAWTSRWHRRQSYNLNRWRLATLTKWNGRWIGGDYSNGKLYTLSWADDAVHENGEPLISERTFPVAHDSGNDLIVNGIRLFVDTGRNGASQPSIAGDVPDGNVGEAISGTYTVSGGIAPYSAITVLSGTFPPGLTLDPDGSYSGTYTTEGSYSWTVGGVDAFGQPFSTPDSAEVILATLGVFLAEITLPDDPRSAYTQATDSGVLAYTAAGVVNVGGTIALRNYSNTLVAGSTGSITTGDLGFGESRTFPRGGQVTGGWHLSADDTNGLMKLCQNGALQARLAPTAGSPADWWYFEANVAPEFGGLVWFYGSSVYVGVRSTGSVPFAYRSVYRWPLAASGSVVPAANTAANVAVVAGDLFMHQDRNGIVRVIDKGAATLKTYDANLTLLSTVAIPVSLTNFRGFGVDRGMILMVYQTSVSGYVLADWSLQSTVAMSAPALTYITRVTFNDSAVFVQRGLILTSLSIT